MEKCIIKLFYETAVFLFWLQHAVEAFRYVYTGMYVCVKAEMSKQKVDPLSQRNSSFAASREVWKYITDSGITTVS